MSPSRPKFVSVIQQEWNINQESEGKLQASIILTLTSSSIALFFKCSSVLDFILRIHISGQSSRYLCTQNFHHVQRFNRKFSSILGQLNRYAETVLSPVALS